MDNGTTSTKNAIMPCASPCNSSSHTNGKSYVELHYVPSCSNNESSTSTSTGVATNLVGKTKEHEAQATSLKKDVEKRHTGKATLDNMLSVKKPPNDKSVLGFNSNNKNKSKFDKKKGQVQVKNQAKIICFKCKL